jgi:hypothetical protein
LSCRSVSSAASDVSRRAPVRPARIAALPPLSGAYDENLHNRRYPPCLGACRQHAADHGRGRQCRRLQVRPVRACRRSRASAAHWCVSRSRWSRWHPHRQTRTSAPRAAAWGRCCPPAVSRRRRNRVLRGSPCTAGP